MVVNHFNSKGGDQPLFGPSQPPTLVSETQRLQQVAIVHSFVADILAEDRRAKVVVLGDLNDFPFSPPLEVLRRGADQRGKRLLFDLVTTLPRLDRYTFIFDGNSQALDNIPVSQALRQGAEIDIVHVNSEIEEDAQAADHDPIVARVRVPGGKDTETTRAFTEGDFSG